MRYVNWEHPPSRSETEIEEEEKYSSVSSPYHIQKAFHFKILLKVVYNVRMMLILITITASKWPAVAFLMEIYVHMNMDEVLFNHCY